jgi:hypothetical protein
LIRWLQLAAAVLVLLIQSEDPSRQSLDPSLAVLGQSPLSMERWVVAVLEQPVLFVLGQEQRSHDGRITPELQRCFLRDGEKVAFGTCHGGIHS